MPENDDSPHAPDTARPPAASPRPPHARPPRGGRGAGPRARRHRRRLRVRRHADTSTDSASPAELLAERGAPARLRLRLRLRPGPPGAAGPDQRRTASATAAPAQGSSTDTTSQASGSQLTGLVRIVTTMKYDGAEAAGTGMVLTSDGEVVTNHHVVEGATSIKVTVMSTGETYTAQVVGTDATDDVAVLQLDGRLRARHRHHRQRRRHPTGDAVTAVGDGNGTVGLPERGHRLGDRRPTSRSPRRARAAAERREPHRPDRDQLRRRRRLQRRRDVRRRRARSSA